VLSNEDDSRKDAKHAKRKQQGADKSISTIHRRDAEYAEGRIFAQSFTAETQSTLREEFLPNRETTIGQNLRASREICFCLSSSPDKQKSHSLRLCGDFLNELAVRRYALGALLFAITHLR